MCHHTTRAERERLRELDWELEDERTDREVEETPTEERETEPDDSIVPTPSD
jgi:hypothetical protein